MLISTGNVSAAEVDAPRGGDAPAEPAGSADVGPTETSPSGPRSVSVTPGDANLTVEWEAPTGAEAAPPTGYLVEWKAADQDWTSASAASVAATGRAYTISDLTNGVAQDLRVAATYDDGTDQWSAESRMAAAFVPRAPTGLKVNSLHEKLRVSWNAPDTSNGFEFANYKVQWKSGDQSYDTTRRELVTETRFAIGGLDNDSVYVVRVSTMKNGRAVASSVIAATPFTARQYIDQNVIPRFEDQFPWVSQAWRNRPLPARLGKALGLYVFTSSSLNGFRGAPKGIRYSFSLKGYQSARVVLHEIGHHFTLDHRANDANDAVGVGWLYFNHRLKGHCAVGQAYTDALAFHTLGRNPKDALARCPRGVRRSVSEAEIRGVIESVANGEIAEWFHDHYSHSNGTVDLEAVWADLRNANDKRSAAFQMRKMFGGYCSLREASWALGSSGPSYGNPWMDGGCDWRKPQGVIVTPGADFLAVSWSPPLYEASPAVTEYVVQWRTAEQAYSTSQQAVISESADLSHTIEDLSVGIEYSVRVIAADDASAGVLVDDNGHSRVLELTATPEAPPLAPLGVTAVGGVESLLVSWQPPEGGSPPARYVVQWRTRQTYDSGDRVVIRDPSASSVLVEGLKTHGRYYVRVVGVNGQGWGTPSDEYFAMSGAPGQPVRLTAQPRPGGGFLLKWDRPDPYYPDNPHYRPVFNRGEPVLDDDGNSVPQFRYDIEYRLDGDPDARWCSKSEYTDVGRGVHTLNRHVHKLDYINSCQHSELVVGQSYSFRIRASYVWRKTGDTNYRNGPWAYGGPVVYHLTGDPPDAPFDVTAVGGVESLVVYWVPPRSGTPANGFVVQWKTAQESYNSTNEIVVSNLSARSVLVEGLANHGRYDVRVLGVNDLGRSEPSEKYFARSGAPGRPTHLTAESRTGGGFTLSWERPDPYYPDNPHYRVVRERVRRQATVDLPFGLKVPIPGKYKYVDGDPILDAGGNTVPRFRYDVEYKLVGDPDASWCSLSDYRNLNRGDHTLDDEAHTLDLTDYCQDSGPTPGSSYRLRIRASYVWLNSGHTDERNGPWADSAVVVYNPN